MQNTEKSEHSHTCPHSRLGVGNRSKLYIVHGVLHSSCLYSIARDSFYPVAFRPRKSPYPMLSVNEALDMIMQHTPTPLLKEERNISGLESIFITRKLVSTLSFPIDALHCVLGQDVDASMPLPPFPASIKDGYAVLSEYAITH